VSLLWRDEVAVFLAPRRVALTRVHRGIRPKPATEILKTVEDGNFSDWTPTLDALKVLLADEAWRNANARVVISDHWARYAVVPWSDDLSGDEERLAHARICLAKVYGDVTDNWRITLSAAEPGRAGVACAVPEALFAALGVLLTDARLKLTSLQPQLIVSFNSWRHRLPDTHGWFVAIDEGSLTAARLVKGGWDRVYSARIGLNWGVELRRLQTFGRLAAEDTEGARVYVDAPQWLRDLAGDREIGVEWLFDADQSAPADGVAVLKRLYA
jgi:hypothetical protein